jgi:hypothetical protein
MYKFNITKNFTIPNFRGAQIFKKPRNRFKILGPRRRTWSKFHTDAPQILGATVQNLVVSATCSLGFGHPCLTSMTNVRIFWPYWRPTNIRRYRTTFNRLDDLQLGTWAPLSSFHEQWQDILVLRGDMCPEIVRGRPHIWSLSLADAAEMWSSRFPPFTPHERPAVLVG